MAQHQKKPPPPNTFHFQAACKVCDRVYEGNYPRWIRIPPFRCLCGAMVPVPDYQPGYYDQWSQFD